MAAYCRRFIVDISDWAASLYDCLKKGQQFIWLEMCESSILHLKEQLHGVNLLIHPNFLKPFVQWGLQCVRRLKVNCYRFCMEVGHWKKLRKIIVGQIRSCWVAISLWKKCEFHLLGNEYVTYTDHEPLIHLQIFCNLVKNPFRRIEYLQSMNVKIFS